MPLMQGASQEVVQANIRKLRAEGKPPKQAVAISLTQAAKNQKKRSLVNGY